MTLAGAIAFSSAALAQTNAAAELLPAPAKIEYRGVIDAVTGQITAPDASLRGTLGSPIYANTAPSGFFYDSFDGRRVIDQGRLPLPTSPDLAGTQESYDISSIQLLYVTDATDPSMGGTGHSIEIVLTENAGACVPSGDTEAPLVTLTLNGMPGSTSGALAGVAIDVDISALNLCMRAEGRDGLSGATTDRFAWSFRVLDNADATAVGPFIMGDPNVEPVGDGTTFQNPLELGTGLGAGDLFRREGGPSNGCFFFGGYPASPYASFGFVLRSNLTGDCIGCGIGDDRFEENDDAMSTRQLQLRTYPALISDNEDDWFRFEVADGQTVQVDALFSDAISDIDIQLRDAAGGTTLASSGSGSDNESLTYTNCTGADETVTLRVYVFGSGCNTYDLVLSDVPAPMDDALEDNDDCGSAIPLPLGLTRGLVVLEDVCSGIADLDYYSIQLADGDTLSVDILFSDAISDLDLFAYDTAIGCDGGTSAPETLDFGFSSTDNENIVVTNGTGGPLDIVIKVDLFGSNANTYDMIAKVSSTPTFGEVICAGNDNSVGNGARLCATGSDVALDNMLSLDVSGAPASQFGLFVASQDVFSVDPAGSQGTLCIASFTLARFNGSLMMTDAMGAASFSPDLTGIPFQSGGMPAPLAVMSGDRVNFQFWHRDLDGPTPTSNFSDALSVPFQ